MTHFPIFRESTVAANQESTTWGWGGWGTMLSQASAGISSVIETVESSLGIPEPEDIAKKVTEDEKSDHRKDQIENVNKGKNN